MDSSWIEIRSSFLDSQLYRSRRHLRMYSDAPRKGDDMGCLGVHFAVTSDEVAQLKSQASDADRLEYLQNEIEEEYFSGDQEFAAETDKAWDAIHRLLTDGRLGYDNGTYPLNHVILGGEPIYSGGDYIMSLKIPQQDIDVAEAIQSVDEKEFRSKYLNIDANDYGFPLSDEDLDYSWHWFLSLKEFYQRMSVTNRFVLFTADQ